MEPLTRQQLETRIFEAIQTILTEGDQSYLQGLSQADLLEALENELRFLGLYAHSDTETPVVIRTILERHIAQWAQDPASREQQDIPESHIAIDASPFAHIRASATAGILRTRVVPYISFTSPAQEPHMQISPNPA